MEFEEVTEKRFAAPVPARLGLWTLLGAALFVVALLVRPGLVQTHSGFLAAFNALSGDAIASVGVAPDLWRGDGIAAYVPAQPLLLFGVAPAMAVQIVMVGSLLLGALAVYVWLQQRMGDRAAALAGLIYLLLPVSLATFYIEGSISGSVALAMIPLALAGIAVYTGQRSLLGAVVTALAILWLWRTQASIALVASVMLVFYALFVERHRGALLLVVGSAIAGGLSLLPIWGIHSSAPSGFVEQLGTLYGLLRATPLASEGVQIGVMAFVLAVTGVWGVWVSDTLEARTQRPLATFAVTVTLVLLLAGMTFTRPFWSWSGLDRFLVAPWQLAIVAAPLLSAAAGCAMSAFPGLRRVPYWASLAVLLLIAAQPWLQPHYTEVTPPRAPQAIVGDNQIAILDARIERGDDTNQAKLDVTWQVLAPLAFDYNIFLQAMEQDGSTLAQLDVQPLDESPATSWQRGDLFTATYTLELPDGATPDAYLYGWYNWQDGARLPVNGGLDNKLTLYGD